ncbi:hypothetical protein IFM51744_09950 [Aspergillus udagawae]|nr:hypothetical protein IFM51744_09950 [Aspergillus udagawae]
MTDTTFSLSDIQFHRVEGDCWIAIHGNVYNVTTFLSSHPGGKAIILRHAGTDATEAFANVHPKELLQEYLTPDQLLGQLEPTSQDGKRTEGTQTHTSPAPPLDSILSIAEMEELALKRLSPKAIAYYASGTDDEITKVANGTIYKSILLRPRVFVDCTHCSLSTTLLGNQVGLPIFVSPAAMAKLAHPSGEAGIAAACSKFNALQIISKNASISPSDIVRAGLGAVFAWQLYVLKDINATERTLAQIKAIPQIKFIVLTLDAPFPGKREADERYKAAEVAGGGPPQVWGTESTLTWRKTLKWLCQHTDRPIVLKGIQTHEDAYAATMFPAVKGIILSNHGGRALDTANTPLQVLLEIRKFCPQVLTELEVFVDGGIKRGTDVVKALALGAKGVGLGRAALYGLAVGGSEGVYRSLQILADEIATAMRLLGVSRVSDLGPQHVNVSILNSRLYDGPSGLGFDSSLMGSINALPKYIEYFGLPENGNASTGIVFAIFQVGQMCGALFIWMTDWYGRTWHIFFGCLGVCIGTIITALASNLPTFIAGRFLLSFFATCAHTAAPLYLVELAPAAYRGTIAGMYNTFYNVGSVLSTSAVYACHKYLADQGNLDWRIPLWLQMLCPGLVCLVIKFYPESPRWLVSKGRHDEAKNTIATYHTNGDLDHPLVALQMREMLALVDEEHQASWKDLVDLRVLVESRSSRYRLMLNIAFSWFGQFSGNNIVSYYLPIMLSGIGITDTDTKLILNIVYAVVGWVSSIFGSRLHDVVGRRKMLITSTAGMTVCLAIVAGCAAGYTDYGNKTASTVSIVFIFLFGAIFACGFTPMQPIYPAEVVSTKMRAKAMGTFKLTAGAAGFLNTFVGPIALSHIGYWFYVFFVFWDTLEMTFMYFFFVETKGCTLEELDVIFDTPNPRKASVEAAKARKRIMSSAAALEKATETLRQQSWVLQLLFPNSSLEELVDKDRSELIFLLLHDAPDVAERPSELYTGALPAAISPVIPSHLEDAPASPEESETGESGEERRWDESAQNPATIAASDDINAISLAGDRHRRSYLGICSSKQWLEVQQVVTRPSIWNPTPALPLPSDSLLEMRYVEFYFEHMHAITPFLHEESFRATFAAADRQTPAWLGLCNMVLTVGSIASGSDTAHVHYYKKARSYLDLDSLGSGNLESLQALCLLGGYYLHYRNSPNMAYAILGAAQRLAIALGLHRESPARGDHHHQDSDASHHRAIRLEIRRRTWWSLYCLDTWATRSLDRELQEWYESLPSLLKETINAPPRITVAREFLRNRYHNVRLMLSRCFLLYKAYGDPTRHNTSQTAEEQQMVDLSRVIAAEAIDAIALHWVPNRTQVWNAAWYLFQECMIPLLSIAMAASSSPTTETETVPSDDVLYWYGSLNKALEIFAEMKPWMRASDRARDIVVALFQAVSQGTEGTIRTPSVVDGGGSHLFGWEDEFLTEVDWSMFLGDENLSLLMNQP